jgi:hypothetical protein
MAAPPRNTPFWLFTVAVFLAPTLPRLVTQGMFLDGMLYAVIARNMAAGLGSFWKPVLTPTLTADFWAEHPPLGIGIESMYFRAFGDHLWVESLYSLSTAVATAALIVLVWRRATRGELAAMAWLPVLAWTMMPQVAWSYSNNMLENTLSVFVLGAVVSVMAAWEVTGARMIAATALAAACVTAGLFTKGVVALFPVAYFAAAWVVSRERGSGQKAILRTVFISALIAALVACVLIADSARENIARYLDTQLVASLSGERGSVANRFGVVRKLFLELAPPLGAALVVLALARWHGGRRGGGADTGGARARIPRGAWTFLALGLSGSLPLVVSPRQSGFYLVPSFPVYAVGIALLAAPAVARLAGGAATRARAWRVFTAVSAALVVAVAAYSATRAGDVGRDRATIDDVVAIGRAAGAGATIGACPSMARNWGLHGYFARYYGVALDTDAVLAHDYVVTGEDSCPPLDLGGYERVALDTHALVLYRRK